MIYALKPNKDRIDQKITVVTFPFRRTSRPRTLKKARNWVFKKKRTNRYGKRVSAVCIKDYQKKGPPMDHILLHQQNKSLSLNQEIKNAFNYILFQIISTNRLSDILTSLAFNFGKHTVQYLFQVTLPNSHTFPYSFVFLKFRSCSVEKLRYLSYISMGNNEQYLVASTHHMGS